MNARLCYLLTAIVAGSMADAASPSIAKQLGTSIADAVEKVMPSVVVVRTEATRYKIAQDWYFGQMYGIPERLAGQGSGMVIGKDGYILTNSHVIDEAQQIEIVLDDGTKFPARLIGKDPHTDIAVVKIDDPGDYAFDPIEIGDSDSLRVGEFVIAIGSPFSLASSVTAGIVSQKGRSIGALPYEDFIQSDAAVNPGNSGGPLVDIDGNMVGVNTMIQTAGYSQGSVGISFAVPANLAMTVAQAIMKNGSWERPWIGISMATRAGDVLVEEVVENSPAAEAGIMAGDILRVVDGKNITEPRDVQRSILRRLVGSEVTLRVSRGDKDIEFSIPTGRMPAPTLRYRQR